MPRTTGQVVTARPAPAKRSSATSRKAASQPAQRTAAAKSPRAAKPTPIGSAPNSAKSHRDRSPAQGSSKKAKTEVSRGPALVKDLLAAQKQVKAIESIMIAEAQKEQASKAASKAAAKEASKAAARPPVAPRQRTGETGSAYIKRLKLLFADDSGGGSDDDSTTADDDSDLESVGPGGVGDDSDDDDDGDDNDGGDDDGDDDGDLTVLYGHDSRRKTAAVKEQQVRYAELSKAMKTKEAEIKRMAARLQLAETAAQQRHQARSSGNQAWSVVDESENDDDDDDDSENEDTGGIACRDIGDLNPTEHPDRLTVTESRVLHDDAARTQSATLYRNYYIKLQIQGFLDQLLVLKRAVAVLRINKKRVDRVIKAGCVDTDLPNARTSMRHELEHLRKAVKVLQGKIQGATIADDCVKPEDAQMLIEKRWAMSDKRASKLLTVVKEVHDSHAFLQQPGAPGADLAPGAK